MKKLLWLTTIALATTNIAFAASLPSLTESQVKQELNNKTIVTIPMVTMNGHLINNTITASFNKDGKLSGQFSSKPDNNDPQADAGTWKVSSDGTLCATWDHWNQTKPICVAIYKVNNGLIFINHDTHKLETIVLADNIKPETQLN